MNLGIMDRELDRWLRAWLRATTGPSPAQRREAPEANRGRRLFAVYGALLAMPLPALGAPASFDLSFATSGQSMWGPGTAVQLDADQTIMGTTWGSLSNPALSFNNIGDQILPSPTFPFFRVTQYGADIRYYGLGSMGLSYDYHFDSGSVNVDYPLRINLDLPEQVNPGEKVVIGTSYELLPGALMTTNSPEFSFGLNFDYRLANRLTVRPCNDGCGATQTVINQDTGNGSFELFGFDSRTAGFSSALDVIENPDPPGSNEQNKRKSLALKILDKLPASTEVGSVTVQIPDVDTDSSAGGGPSPAGTLTSSGEDDFITARMDVDTVLLALAGLPNIQDPGPISVGPIGGQYSFIDAGIGTAMVITQDFAFQGRPILLLRLADGTTVQVPLGETIELDLPAGTAEGDLLEIQAQVLLENIFSNSTGLRLDPQGDLRIGYVEAHADFFGSNFDIDWDAGPAFSRNLRLSGPAIAGIFGDQWALDFGALPLGPISIRVGDPQPVPLPAAFWPLAGAVGLMLAKGRRRR